MKKSWQEKYKPLKCNKHNDGVDLGPMIEEMDLIPISDEGRDKLKAIANDLVEQTPREWDEWMAG